MHSWPVVHVNTAVTGALLKIVWELSVPMPRKANPAVARTAPVNRIAKMRRIRGNFANIGAIVGHRTGSPPKAFALDGGLKMLQTRPGSTLVRPAHLLRTPARAATRPLMWFWAHRLHPRAPLWLLGVLSLGSLGARL